MTRLWDKGQPLNALIHAFTVNDDPLWDAHLVRWDCIGSAAHAHVLEAAGLLTTAERIALCQELAQIASDADAGAFQISAEHEDCHTAIEHRLTRQLGDIGKKIHAGRSRNDQVATAMRLFLRRHALRLVQSLDEFASAVLQRLRRDGHLQMPGYTHLQRAMPSSVGQWLHAWAEATLELMQAGLDLARRLDCCPLGVGAGFGVPLPLDRPLAARLLGFSRVQRSPVDVQNSRGRFETYAIRLAVDVGAMLEKLASDLVLWCSAEFGFARLPEAFTTGSSIMPQKRNPDVAELLRARGSRLRGFLSELEWVRAKLPSNYHRDLQLTKPPTIRAMLEVQQLLAVATAVITEVQFDERRLKAAMTHDLHATAAAYDLVRQGVPFRDAYRQVAARVANHEPLEIPEHASDPALVSTACLAELSAELSEQSDRAAKWLARIRQSEAALLSESR